MPHITFGTGDTIKKKKQKKIPCYYEGSFLVREDRQRQVVNTKLIKLCQEATELEKN